MPYRLVRADVARTPGEEILRRALFGEITPKKAEAEAAAVGLPPFSVRPDPAKYDPMVEPWWTLGMAAAWIIWRTPKMVRSVWWDYRRKFRQWSGLVTWDAPNNEPLGDFRRVTGYRLERLRELSLFDVLEISARATRGSSAPIMAGDAAQRELWRRLESGDLAGAAIGRDGSRTPVREAEWLDLDHFRKAGWAADAIGARHESKPRYLKVRIRGTRVVELWPRELGAPNLEVRAEESRLPSHWIAIRSAYASLWPDGMQPGLPVQKRDDRLIEHIKNQGLPPPGRRTISRALKIQSKT